MSNIATLREYLFDTLKDLKAGTIDCEKAKVISDVSQVIINSAKVEVDFIKANGGGRSQFIDNANANPTTTKIKTKTGTLSIEGNKTVHKMAV